MPHFEPMSEGINGETTREYRYELTESDYEAATTEPHKRASLMDWLSIVALVVLTFFMISMAVSIARIPGGSLGVTVCLGSSLLAGLVAISTIRGIVAKPSPFVMMPNMTVGAIRLIEKPSYAEIITPAYTARESWSNFQTIVCDERFVVMRGAANQLVVIPIAAFGSVAAAQEFVSRAEGYRAQPHATTSPDGRSDAVWPPAPDAVHNALVAQPSGLDLARTFRIDYTDKPSPRSQRTTLRSIAGLLIAYIFIVVTEYRHFFQRSGLAKASAIEAIETFGVGGAIVMYYTGRGLLNIYRESQKLSQQSGTPEDLRRTVLTDFATLEYLAENATATYSVSALKLYDLAKSVVLTTSTWHMITIPKAAFTTPEDAQQFIVKLQAAISEATDEGERHD